MSILDAPSLSSAQGDARYIRGNSPTLLATNPTLGKVLGHLAKSNIAPVRLAFTGSSTTAGQNASTEAKRYVNQLVSRIQVAYPSGLALESDVIAHVNGTWGTLSTNVGVHGYNCGEGGTTSATYLGSTEISAIASLAPAAVFHMIGANDYANNIPVATYKANVQQKITDLKAAISNPHTHILIQTYPRTTPSTPAAAWSLYGQALAEIAAADPDNVLYMDISAPYPLLGWPGTDPLDIIDTDGIHQTDAGHALMTDLIARGLGLPGARVPGKAAPRTLGRVTSTGPTVDAADIVGTNTDVLLGGTPKTFVGSATSAAASSGKIVRGSAPLSAWFVGLAEPVADVEFSLVVEAFPVGQVVNLDLHRVTSPGSGGPDRYRATLGTTGSLQLSKLVSSVATNLSTIKTCAVGDRVGIRYYRGTLSMLINGEIVATATDNSVPAKGFSGLSSASSITSFSFSGLCLEAVT